MTTLITPECAAPGCTATGDQFTMVRCRRCGAWVCPEHVTAEEGVMLRRYGRSAPSDLKYYQGLCVSCAHDHEQARPAPSIDEASVDASAMSG